MNGLLYINKPCNMTSFDVVAKVRKAYKTKSVGHTGTLDPEATGVLIVMIGKACKANPYLMHDKKEYIATMRLGKKYDTGDIWGEIIEEKKVLDLTIDKIQCVLQSFLGKQLQVPPMYSAVKVNGKKLYEYARANQSVEVAAREIEIYDIEFLKWDEEITFRVVCSAGTYIRTLCEDIAVKLNTLGAMSSLMRTKIDEVNINQCFDLNYVLENLVNPIDIYDVLSNRYKTIEINDDLMDFNIKNGKKIQLDCNDDLVCFVKNNQAVAMYEKDGEFYRSKRGLW